MLNGSKICFTNKSKTYYRQTKNNVVGMGNKLNDENLKKGLFVKKEHFKLIIDYCKINNLKNPCMLYEHKLNEILDLESKLRNNKFKNEYIRIVNQNYEKIFKGWWSEIINLNDIKYYEK